MHYYFDVLKKFADFKSRATRKEYWMFILFNLIIGFVLGLIEGLSGINSGSNESILANIYQLIILVPSIALGIRRMHDVNKSGWYLLVPIYNFILTLRVGDEGGNEYGPDPKGQLNISEKQTTKKFNFIFCSKCGKQIAVDSKYCTYCGLKTNNITK